MRDRSWRYATDAQRAYLKRLFKECFVKGIEVGVGDTRAYANSERLLKTEASATIDRVKSLLTVAKNKVASN
jgi:hypothetical protein